MSRSPVGAREGGYSRIGHGSTCLPALAGTGRHNRRRELSESKQVSDLSLRGVLLDTLEADDPRVIGDFRLQARLGAGGMGRVYLAFSPAGRAVAVKVIHPHLARDPAFAARFRREVAAAQAVNAIYAAPVVAAGPDDDPPWLATAFVPAPSLQDLVMAAGPLPEDAVWKLAAGLAEGLRAVHASGLVHRDLKPSNVLMATDGPRVIDFGIARVLDGTRLTSTDDVLGTPTYMSPEQARGGSVDPPSDIFSLGGVVYFAATGQAPFGGGITAAMLYRIVFDEPNLDALPPQLRSLVGACLDKNPATRPTPAQLATALMPAMPAGSLPTASRLAFWPEPVAGFIRDYQARLDAESAQAPPLPDAAQASPAPQGSPVPQGPAAWPGPVTPPSASTPQSGVPGGQVAAGTWPAPASGVASGWQPVGEPTVRPAREPTVRPVGEPTVEPVGEPTVRPPGARGRHAQRTGPGPGMGRRRALAALAGAAAAGLGIAGWEVSQHVATGSGAKTLTARQPGLKPVPPGTMAWRFNVGRTGASVAAAGPVVYAVTNGNTVFALDAATGKQIWRRATTSDENIYLATTGSSLIIGGENGPFALAADNGRQLWNVPSQGASPLLEAGGVVYAGFAVRVNTTGGVTALNPATGTVAWTFQFPGAVDTTAALAVADGVVYATTSNGEIFALSAADGTRRQRVSGFGEFGAGTIGVVGGVVYAGLYDQKGTVVGVDVASGKTLWQDAYREAEIPSSVISADGVVFTGLPWNAQLSRETGHSLYALNAATGKPLWSATVNGVNAGPVAAGGVIYTGSGDGVLDAWQARTGRKLWSYSGTGPARNLAVVAGSRVYLGAGEYVYSFGA
jgi:serine/threonine protein kinase/outer membrane protein assembly factor BamB